MFLFCVQPTSTASHQRSFGFAQVWKTTCVLYQSMKSVSSLVAEFWSPYQPFTLWLAATHQCSVRNWKEKAVESVDAKPSTSGEPRSSWTGSRGRRGNSQEMQGFVCDLYPSYKRNPSWALVWLEKTALNSKPIPQFDITNYLALMSRSYSIRIRGQTFSDSWVEQNLFFSVLAAGLIRRFWHPQTKESTFLCHCREIRH